MSTYKNVEIIKAANIYFDGKVTSRIIKLNDGSTKTLGIMMPGEFEFSTEKHELMEILAGEMNVLLPGSDRWKTIQGGESFEVPAQSIFKLQVNSVGD